VDLASLDPMLRWSSADGEVSVSELAHLAERADLAG
jgi:hypothetical protein